MNVKWDFSYADIEGSDLGRGNSILGISERAFLIHVLSHLKNKQRSRQNMDFTSHRCHVEGCSLAPEPNAPATRIPEISTLTQRGRQLHTRALAQQVPKFQQPGPKSRMADFAKHAPSLCSQLSIRKVTLSPQR